MKINRTGEVNKMRIEIRSLEMTHVIIQYFLINKLFNNSLFSRVASRSEYSFFESRSAFSNAASKPFFPLLLSIKLFPSYILPVVQALRIPDALVILCSLPPLNFLSLIFFRFSATNGAENRRRLIIR